MLHCIQHLSHKSPTHHYWGQYDLNAVMLKKASWAAFALSSILDNTVSAATINKLFNQLIEPILLYGSEQWLPYIHPRKVDHVGLTKTYTCLSTQLSTEKVWKNMTYSHYSIHSTTPILGVRAEMEMYPTYIPAVIQLTKYMANLVEDNSNPIIQKAVITHKTMGSKSKYSWWSNAWRLLSEFHITEATISSNNTKHLKDELQGAYRRWWIEFMAVPTNMPKLSTFRQFHPSFHVAPYLNQAPPPHLRAQAICFCCSNHRLDIELGRHSQTPRNLRTCRFCKSGSIGDAYHAFQYTKFLDLQVHYDIHIASRPQFHTAMQSFQLNTQRYITALMFHIKYQ